MGLPHIIGGVCEWCGIKAASCDHNLEFRKAGLLRDEALGAFVSKLRSITSDEEGNALPPVIGDMCEYCGVYFLDEKCKHLPLRRKAAFGDEEAKDDTRVIAIDTADMEAQKAANASKGEEPKSRPKSRASLPKELGGEKESVSEVQASPVVEPSGDPEMDALMDADEQEAQEV